jgi:uncharacterized protein YigE (DUF2233 family)
MSKKEINFYDFANYLKSLGCNRVLYLDGFVSRTYLPEKIGYKQMEILVSLLGLPNKKKINPTTP